MHADCRYARECCSRFDHNLKTKLIYIFKPKKMSIQREPENKGIGKRHHSNT